jgi:hypothetical protein
MIGGEKEGAYLEAKGKHRPAVDILLGPFPTKISKREYMGSNL